MQRCSLNILAHLVSNERSWGGSTRAYALAHHDNIIPVVLTLISELDFHAFGGGADF